MSADVSHLEPWETDEWQWFYEQRQVQSEADWLACPNPERLLDYVNLADRASRRKFFLAGVACVRRVWHLLTRRESRAAVEAAEQFADGHITEEQLRAIEPSAEAAWRRWPEDDPRCWAGLAAAWLNLDARGNHGNAELTMYAIREVVRAKTFVAGPGPSNGLLAVAEQDEMRSLADLYRCVLGNPFGPVELDPRWRTADVVGLAQGIYEDRAFDRLPILADALTDTGCDDESILGHCRNEGPHPRGCWVVDLVLGKK
jgi:hypothetical protein